MMKKYSPAESLIRIIVISMMLFMYSSDIYAADDDPVSSYNPDWAFTIYPVSTVYMAVLSSFTFFDPKEIYLSGEAEYRLSRYFSIPVELRYVNLDLTEIIFFNRFECNVFIAGPGIRFYPQGEGIKGFFIGHYSQFVFGTVEKSNMIFGTNEREKYHGLTENYHYTTWIGYRLGDENIHLEGSVGCAGYFKIRDKKYSGEIFYPVFGLGAGVAF